jgi:peptide/nickel transport system substrate-binding protein
MEDHTESIQPTDSPLTTHAHVLPCLVLLRSIYTNLTGAERRVADFILNSSHLVLHSTVADVARLSEVGVGTVGRLCVKLGYNGFPALKVALAAEFMTLGVGVTEQIGKGDSSTVVMQKVFSYLNRNAADTAAILDPAQIEKAAVAIAAARRIDIYASGALSRAIGQILYFRLLQLGLTCALIMQQVEQELAAGLLHQDDVAIGLSHSGESEPVVSALGIALGMRANTIAISNTQNSSITKVARIRLLAASGNNGEVARGLMSHIGMLAIVDTLYACIQLSMEPSAKFRRTTGYTRSTAADASNAGTLHIAVPYGPRSLDPQRRDGTYERLLHTLLYDTLLTASAHLAAPQLSPHLAMQWHRIDNCSIELQLRPDVFWHNGAPFTAEDVVYTFQRLMAGNQDLEFANSNYWPLASVERLDQYRVRLTAAQPDPLLETRLARSAGAFIVHTQTYESKDAHSHQAIVGTGPYQLVDWQPEAALTLAPNTSYFAESVDLPDMVFHSMSSPESRLDALLAGEIALITDVRANDLGNIPSSSPYESLTVLSSQLYMLLFNMRAHPLQKQAIRQALSLSIDRSMMIDQAFGGYAVHPRGFQFPGETYYDSQRALTPYDPYTARELLVQGEYEGEPVILQVSTYDYYIQERAMSEHIVAMWRSLGINAHLEYRDVRQMDTLVHPDNHQTHVLFTSSVSCQDPTFCLYGQWGPHEAIQRSGWWDASSVQAFNTLGAQLVTNFDSEQRRELYGEMLDAFEREVPGCPLVIPEKIYVAHRSVRAALHLLTRLDLRSTEDR